MRISGYFCDNILVYNVILLSHIEICDNDYQMYTHQFGDEHTNALYGINASTISTLITVN